MHDRNLEVVLTYRSRLIRLACADIAAGVPGACADLLHAIALQPHDLLVPPCQPWRQARALLSQKSQKTLSRMRYR